MYIPITRTVDKKLIILASVKAAEAWRTYLDKRLHKH